MRIDAECSTELPVAAWEEGPGACSDIPFRVASLAGETEEIGAASRPQRSGYFKILYITQGTGSFFVDFEGFPIASGAMFFINPGQVHYADLVGTVQGYVLSFPEDFLSIDPSRESTVFELAFFQSPDREPVALFEGSAADDIVSLVESIRGEFSKRGSGYITVLRSYLHILLVRASRGLRAPVQPKTVSSAIATTRRFRQLVAEQVRTVRSVNSYAQQLGISPGHLHDVVKSSASVTPSEVIQQELMLEAKRLLAHTDMSIAEVGHQLCFDDPAYFGRYFRRNQKQSPGQYRNQVRKMFWSANAETAA